VLVLLALTAITVAGCLPALPEADVVADLRVLAISANPTVLRPGASTSWLCLEGLVVHPDLQAEVEHRWSLGTDELPPEVAGLIPPEPHARAICLPLGPVIAYLPELVGESIPIRYTVTDGTSTFEAVKLIPIVDADAEIDSFGPTVRNVRVGGQLRPGGEVGPGRLGLLNLDAEPPIEVEVDFDDNSESGRVDGYAYRTGGVWGVWEDGSPNGVVPTESGRSRFQVHITSTDPDDRFWVVGVDEEGGQTWQALGFSQEGL